LFLVWLSKLREAVNSFSVQEVNTIMVFCRSGRHRAYVCN
jgi:hypothetical protein